MGWTNREGVAVFAPEPPAVGSYYTEIGDFQGAAYARNAFALGTAQELAFLLDVLELSAGQLVLDVGCGIGRHAHRLAEVGLDVLGIDISQGLLAAAVAKGGTARFVRADARNIPVADGRADAVICLCQGGFGITPGGDLAVLQELARVLRPGGQLVLTAFSLAFALQYLAPEDAIDRERGLVWSPAEVRGADGELRRYDLWTSCYEPQQLSELLESCGLAVESVAGVEPGAYGWQAVTAEHPEFLIVARRR